MVHYFCVLFWHTPVFPSIEELEKHFGAAANDYCDGKTFVHTFQGLFQGSICA